MDIRITTTILGAILGGVITYAVGPLVKDVVDKGRNDSSWQGIWTTVTCRVGQPERLWTITLSQNGNNVTGHYVGAAERNARVRGMVAGTVSVTSLSGEWSQLNGGDIISGSFTFLQKQDGGVFEGTYSNSRDGNNGEWFGTRSGPAPECPT